MQPKAQVSLNLCILLPLQYVLYRFWFNFTIENTQADQRIIFNVVNISKHRNLLASGLTPVVKSTSRSVVYCCGVSTILILIFIRPRWQRMPSRHVFYYRSNNHNNNYVLSFAFCFDKEDEVYQFAMCQPFSYSRHKVSLCLSLCLYLYL